MSLPHIPLSCLFSPDCPPHPPPFCILFCLSNCCKQWWLHPLSFYITFFFPYFHLQAVVVSPVSFSTYPNGKVWALLHSMARMLRCQYAPTVLQCDSTGCLSHLSYLQYSCKCFTCYSLFWEECSYICQIASMHKYKYTIISYSDENEW